MGDNKYHILVVEDEPVILHCWATMLKNKFDVLQAENGDKAWGIIEQHQGQIPVIITDIDMPGMDGLQLARRVHARYPLTRVLFVSGMIDDAAAFYAFNSGFYCLPKPCESYFLKLASSQLLREWQHAAGNCVPPEQISPEAYRNLPIMIVDDDPIICDMWRATLSSGFSNLITAADGQEAWEKYQACEQEVAVVLTDIDMPRLSGLQLIRKIEHQSKHTQFVVITGQLDDALALQLMAFNACGLPKPVEPLYTKLAIYRSLARYIELRDTVHDTDCA